jgi:hypothetical protein
MKSESFELNKRLFCHNNTVFVDLGGGIIALNVNESFELIKDYYVR